MRHVVAGIYTWIGEGEGERERGVVYGILRSIAMID